MRRETATDKLLDYVQGKLRADEERRVEDALSGSNELQDELRFVRAVRDAGRIKPEAELVKPFFLERLQRRLASSAALETMPAADDFFDYLVRLFRPVALASLILIVVLAIYNLKVSSDYAADLSATEAVLALPPVTLAAAYTTLDLQEPEPSEQP